MEAFLLRLWDGRIGRWLSPDPYGQYASPYLGMGNNPISMIDPDGGLAGPGDEVKPGEGTSTGNMQGTLANGMPNGVDLPAEQLPAVVVGGRPKSSTLSTVVDIGTDFLPFSGIKDVYKGYQSGNGWQMAMGVGFIVFDAATLGSGSLMKGGIKAAIKVGEKELAKEAFENLAKSGIKYTKSSMSLGRKVHASYRIKNVVKNVAEKEFRQIPGIRPDFVDLEAKIIYELKPFNKNGFKSGTKQLAKYKSLLEKEFGGEFTTVLEFY